MHKNLIFLSQTDTTVGFLSPNSRQLAAIKQRSNDQKTLQEVVNYKILCEHIRVPSIFKKIVRRAKKTTFIYPNKEAFRVISSQSRHARFLSKIQKIYSTSANLTQQSFDEIFARNVVDIIVEDNFKESTPSSIIQLSKTKYKKIR